MASKPNVSIEYWGGHSGSSPHGQPTAHGIFSKIQGKPSVLKSYGIMSSAQGRHIGLPLPGNIRLHHDELAYSYFGVRVGGYFESEIRE